MTPKQIAQAAINKLKSKIANDIFAIIQNDHRLMREYQRAIEEYGLNAVNRQIGKHIKAEFGLTNDGRNKKPSSTLIKSHQKYS